jgi:alkyldihydroxyacetonephosphate synthase
MTATKAAPSSITDATSAAVDPSDQRGERFDGWGYADTAFDLENGVVKLSGSRYKNSGKFLPALLPWASVQLGAQLELRAEYQSTTPTPVAPARPLPELERDLSASSIAFSTEDRLRKRHGHGHALEEVYAIRLGQLRRVPDLVTYPSSEAQVETLVRLAQKHAVVLVPFGGGTNVSHALTCPEHETRAIVSVDLRRMNRILELNETDRIAHIEAGAVGQDVQNELERRGYTLGHEPDSIEFSTLGGWIATRSSGMKKNRYGNIEELVLDVNFVTPKGVIGSSGAMPRESMGIDPRSLAFGSEGNFGIITSAKVKIFPFPEARVFDSILFHDFHSGVAFLQELAQTTTWPASARLMDNFQFQFGQALKPESHGGAAKLKSRLERRLVTGVLGFNPDQMVACTLLYEGNRDDVKRQLAQVRRLGRKYRGFAAGPENGERGYQLTFSIAYIRDFLMRFGIIAESFETSVRWSDLETMVSAVRARIHTEHQRMKLPGHPIISARVTQVYHGGAAVYFYLGSLMTGVAHPDERFAELEHAARDEILKTGGSISHHHGVGKLRAGFVDRVKSQAGQGWIRGAKREIDPDNLFGIANQGLEGETKPS